MGKTSVKARPKKKTKKDSVKNKKLMIRLQGLLIFLAVLFSLVVTQLAIFSVNKVFARAPILGLTFDKHAVGTPLFDQQRNFIVQQAIARNAAQEVTVEAGSYSEKVLPAKIGIVFTEKDLDNSLNQVGRTGTFWDQLLVQDKAFLGLVDQKVNATKFDQASAQNYLDYLKKVNRTVRDASFTLRDGKVAIQNDQTGMSLDDFTAIAAIRNFHASDKKIRIPVGYSAAEIKSSDLETILPLVEKAVASPIKLEGASQEIPLNPEKILSFLSYKKVDKKLQLNLNETSLVDFINNCSQKLNIEPKAEVTDGTNVIYPGTPGRRLDVINASAQIKRIIIARENKEQNLSDKITLPIQTISPPVIVQKPKTVFLTFDDAPGQATSRILDILKSNGVHATFFVVGSFALSDPPTVKRIVDEGNTIGNHTYDHIDLRPLSYNHIYDQLSRAQQTISSITGITPRLFRAPFSFYSQNVRKATTSLGMQIMSYTVDPGDWAMPGTTVIKNRVMAKVRSGAVVIMHVDYQTAEALPSIIESLRNQGYIFKY